MDGSDGAIKSANALNAIVDDDAGFTLIEIDVRAGDRRAAAALILPALPTRAPRGRVLEAYAIETAALLIARSRRGDTPRRACRHAARRPRPRDRLGRRRRDRDLSRRRRF